MYVWARVLLSFPIAALLACGSSSTNVSATGGGAQSGDYVLTVAPGTAGASLLSGGLRVTGTSVTGAFFYDNPGTLCVSPSEAISVSGSILNGTVKLTSASFSGSVATIAFPVPLLTDTTGQQTSTGDIVIAGGPCALKSITLVARFIPSFAGNWTGMFDTTQASLGITESPSLPNQFPGSFSVSTTGSFCGANSVTLTGSVTGTNLQMSSSDGKITLSATPGTAPNSLTITETCPTSSSTGTFTD